MLLKLLSTYQPVYVCKMCIVKKGENNIYISIKEERKSRNKREDKKRSAFQLSLLDTPIFFVFVFVLFYGISTTRGHLMPEYPK